VVGVAVVGWMVWLGAKPSATAPGGYDPTIVVNIVVG
jgi:hypothetical protein